MTTEDGPAEPGSPLRVALDLLIVRGCTIEYTPDSPNTLECYICRYKSGAMSRARMFYADKRGVSQALGLLKDLNDDKVYSDISDEYADAWAYSLAATIAKATT